MKKYNKTIALLMAAALFLAGCSEKTREVIDEPVTKEVAAEESKTVEVRDLPAVANDAEGFNGQLMKDVPAGIQHVTQLKDEVIYHIYLISPETGELTHHYYHLVQELKADTPILTTENFIIFSGVVDAEYDLSGKVTVERTPVLAIDIVAGDAVEVLDPTTEAYMVDETLPTSKVVDDTVEVAIKKVTHGERFSRVYYTVTEVKTGESRSSYIIPTLKIEGVDQPVTSNGIHKVMKNDNMFNQNDLQVAVFDVYDHTKEAIFILSPEQANSDLGTYSFTLPAIVE